MTKVECVKGLTYLGIAYNKEFEKIEGMILIRGEAIPDGFYSNVGNAKR